MRGELCLIGYRALRHDKFFRLLLDAKVKVLLDVRGNPTSPNPDYRKAALELVAEEYGVRYFHLPQLGHPAMAKGEQMPGAPTTMEEKLATSSAMAALDRILKLLEKGHNVALMCSEPNYLDCHRASIVERLQELDSNVTPKRLTAVGEQRLF